MINETLYTKTVDILVQAYFNDTLEHGICTACAVGNLCAANLGYVVTKKLDWKSRNGVIVLQKWSDVFLTDSDNNKQDFWRQNYKGKAKKEILSTGYTMEQLARIEYAFETADKLGDYMFNGLMAVIDVLDIIHENTDTVTSKAVKQRFVKQGI